MPKLLEVPKNRNYRREEGEGMDKTKEVNGNGITAQRP